MRDTNIEPQTTNHEIQATRYEIREEFTLSLSKGLPCVAFCEAGPSTTVEDSLQIGPFMQNKPNLVRRRRIANEHKSI